MTSVILEQSITRAVVSLCTLAARVDTDDVREDVRDAAVTLVRLCMAGQVSDADELRRWCSATLSLLESLPLEELSDRIRAACLVSVLRLQAALPAPVVVLNVLKNPVGSEKSRPSVPPLRTARSLNGNQRKILQAVKEHPRIRTRELIERFAGSLSDRTVMRVLKELSGLELVRRIEQDNTVVYEVVAIDSV